MRFILKISKWLLSEEVVTLKYEKLKTINWLLLIFKSFNLTWSRLKKEAMNILC